MERSLKKRSETITNLPQDYELTAPDIFQSDLVFGFSKYNSEVDESLCEENSVKATHPGNKIV